MKVFLKYFLIIFLPIYIISTSLLIIDAIQNKMQVNKGVLIAMIFILLTFPTVMASFVSASYGNLVTKQYSKFDSEKQEEIIKFIDNFAINKVNKTEKTVAKNDNYNEIIYYDKNIILKWLKHPLKIMILDDETKIIGSKETMRYYDSYLKENMK